MNIEKKIKNKINLFDIIYDQSDFFSTKKKKNKTTKLK